MKTTIIDEILAPLDDFVATADLGKYNKTKLILALNAVRADMDSFFADAFDPDDDTYYDELSDAGFQAGKDAVYDDTEF